jgi:hypothetical protein
MIRCPVRVVFLLLVGLVLGSPGVARADVVHLTLQSQPGDFIGQGQNFDLTYTTPASMIFASIGGPLVNGQPTEVSFVLFNAVNGPPNTFGTLNFGTKALGVPLVDGTYLDAQRDAFAAAGHPGLDVTFQNRGSNTLTGNFTIKDLQFQQTPTGFTLLAFDATFEQHSEGFTPALFGEIQFNEPVAAEVPEPTSVMLFAVSGIGLLGYHWRRRNAAA